MHYLISLVISLAAGVTPARPASPRTVDQAVATIVGRMTPAENAKIRGTKKDDLIRYHHGWGTGIRNEFGLWETVSPLRDDCGRLTGTDKTHPDTCSMQIIEAVWERLQRP